MDQTQICPRFEKGIQIASKRWACLIIYQLLEGPKRFCAMETALNISGRLLSERLKELETEGIVKRIVYPETPVRIEYSLTQKGLAFESILSAIQTWSQTWIEPDSI
ncbi:transcriptional regulator [Paenibacillus sp. CAA11]|uniref:winged helix-turn-helix transcriptional regulator n=1 Tax=Paenibacillus sp. CAA11 TaxID=1532905 RepID=UPI000D3AA967|nr:winged helix-turn-helix transcriptional regulator [Paenibacillus sp. CAA11]AWB46032.1 transcriptional regulator [Paenibacillus sp. CAA11]